jgi:hypothetical protein
MNTAPTTYTIRVNGHLDDHWSPWLGELDMSRNDDGTTTITTLIADQAQLHGVLAGLRDIGAAITELRTTGAPVSTAKPSQTSPVRRRDRQPRRSTDSRPGRVTGTARPTHRLARIGEQVRDRQSTRTP